MLYVSKVSSGEPEGDESVLVSKNEIPASHGFDPTCPSAARDCIHVPFSKSMQTNIASEYFSGVLLAQSLGSGRSKAPQSSCMLSSESIANDWWHIA
jgi:hypothetical protein